MFSLSEAVKVIVANLSAEPSFAVAPITVPLPFATVIVAVAAVIVKLFNESASAAKTPVPTVEPVIEDVIVMDSSASVPEMSSINNVLLAVEPPVMVKLVVSTASSTTSSTDGH